MFRLDVRTPNGGKAGGSLATVSGRDCERPRADAALSRALAHSAAGRVKRGVTFAESTEEPIPAVTEFQCQKVRVREFYIGMQRCPYIHEMKERLLAAPGDEARPRESPRALELTPDPHVGTIVKLNSDGYGSHTSPARAPLVPDECDALPEETDALTPSEALRHCDALRHRDACCQPDTKPKNAK